MTARMSEHELLVRDIVANILLLEPAKITADSDFFLLGGNSLLLGKLAYHIRREMCATVPVAALFTHSTIDGIASLIETQEKNMSNTLEDQKRRYGSGRGSESALPSDDDLLLDDKSSKSAARGQNHPLSLIVQAIPIIFFYPLKTALTCQPGLSQPDERVLIILSGTILLFVLSYLAKVIDGSDWLSLTGLIAAVATARAASRVVCPLAAIMFKWIVIGKYKPGTYRM
jgi:acyl carrier protein